VRRFEAEEKNEEDDDDDEEEKEEEMSKKSLKDDVNFKVIKHKASILFIIMKANSSDSSISCSSSFHLSSFTSQHFSLSS